jgi:hypothetical protein
VEVCRSGRVVARQSICIYTQRGTVNKAVTALINANRQEIFVVWSSVLRLGHVDLTTRLSLEKLGEHERSYAGDGMFAGGKWARRVDPWKA